MRERVVGYGVIKPGEPDVHIVDGYEVTCGNSKQMIYMDMYHCEQPPPTSPPPGFGVRAASSSSEAQAGEQEWMQYMQQGDAAYERGDIRAGIAAFELALRKAEAFGPEHTAVAASLHKLAGLYYAQRRYAEAEPLYRRSLAIREKALGLEHPDVAASLYKLAELYRAQGRYAEAEPLLRRSLAILEKALGPEHRYVAIPLNNLAELYQTQGRYAEAEPLYRRALAIREKALGPEHPAVARSLNDLATLYHSQSRYADAEPLLRRSLAIREKALGPEHLDVAASLNNLAYFYQAQSRYAEAEPLSRRSLAIYEKALGPEHHDVANPLNNLARLYNAQGRYAEAEPLLRRSLAIGEKALGPERPYVATQLNNLAEIYKKQGRYAEAEPLYRRSLAILEKAFGPENPAVAISLNNLAVLYETQGRYAEAEPLVRRALAINEKALGPEHPGVATSLNSLATLYHSQGRYADAEPLYRRALANVEKALGPEHPNVATSLNNLAYLYQAQSRYAEAEPLSRRSLAIKEKVFGPEHPDVATSLLSLATLYHSQGRYADAEPLYRRSLAIKEKALGPEHPDVATVLSDLAMYLYRPQRGFAEAESLRRRSLAIREKALGPEHPDVADSLASLASMYRVQKKIPQALESARRGTRILVARFGARAGFEARGAISEQRRKSKAFEQHVALAYAAAGEALERRAALLAEALDAAQGARSSDTADQISRMAARQAAASDRLAQIARNRQDLLARWERLDADILAQLSQPTARRQPEREARLRADQQAVRASLEQLDAQIEQEFPQYRELTDPRPLKLDAAQKLLAHDEALVAMLATEEATFVWVVGPQSADFQSVALPRKELAAAVQSLRRQLDLSTGDPAQMLAKPFDVAASHELYKKLLGPFEKELAGVKHLIVVPDGPLQSLPLGVLVTEPPAAPVAAIGDHAKVAWLAKRYAITTLPAVGSLRALRAFAKAAPAPDPFGGFGDPLLEGGKSEGRNADIATLFSRGAVADVNQVRKLARLPETADELRAIATALKAPRDHLHLGRAATEAQVKKLDLSRFRNVAFATHGLMSGEFKGMVEPALVLTPPDQGSELDDGLLTASEISQLKLNADWVILSACNTAAPDGTPGAEGFSGLTKAFFYSGARSLLVSHWAVESGAAVSLTTRMFEESANGAPKAEALRRSMLALMQTKDKPHYAHPAFWAPFVVVGEGNDGWAGERPVTATPASTPPETRPSSPVSASQTTAPPVPPKPVSGGEQDPIGNAVQGVRRLFDRIFSGDKDQQ
ncbi:MAG: CHAT domain-containing protein [Betaproteobacteria bacterium]|nr:CHAT domain-containing protein [Betaproteobacteria bacterium]